MKAHLARVGVVALLLSLSVAACGAGEADADDDYGLRFRGKATPEEAGLPSYPGARPYEDDDQDAAAKIGVSTPLFGIKVVAMNLVTDDKPEGVAAFYRRAMAKYGEVLECSESADRKQTFDRDDKDGEPVTCDADEPGEDSVVYKVGVEENQRIVAIRPHGGGTRFSIVHVALRGDDKK